MHDPSKPLWVNEEPKDLHLFVGTPVHSEVSIHYAQCLLEIQKYFFKKDVPSTFQLHKSSLVTQGRNLTLAAFLDSKASHLLFLDSDIYVDPETVDRMIQKDKDVICVAYPLKSFQWEKMYECVKKGRVKNVDDLKSASSTYPIRLLDSKEISVKDEVAEIESGPTGCMLIKRETINKMIKHYNDLTIKQKTVINGELIEKVQYNFFDTYYDKEKKNYMGEDYGFCRLWKNIGGTIHLLVNAPIMHVGEHQYQGQFSYELLKA